MSDLRWRYPLVLLVLFGVFWTAMAIAPSDRSTWLLENSLSVAAVAGLAALHRRLPFSRVSYTLIFVFLCLHTLGAHYTYSEVPYRDWIPALGGTGRNHYDRLVHFAYGLLLAYPVREVYLRVADARGFWGYFLPLDLTMSTSMIYELIEWAAAVVFGGDVGQSYLGTQGDEWDAHKDMALASLGALVAMGVTAAINWRFQRDFAREWDESLRVKHAAPLGEEALARMVREEDAR
jgi:putative membrane protein